MKFLAFATLLAVSTLCASAAIDGTVVNATSGKTAAGITVTLLKPGATGMKQLGTTTTDASGHFAFQQDQPGGGPQLLQASYEGVNYNKLLTPNIPTSNVELQVYDSTSTPNDARISERMVLVEPSSSQIAISETTIVENNSKTTYNNSSLGGLVFFLPPAANGQVRVNVQGPQGMPLPRAAERTAEKDVYKVDFPIKPGQTEFEVSYVLPAGSPFTFRSRVMSVKGMAAGPLRLIAPAGVSLTGGDVQRVGVEPKTQATIYTVVASGNYSAQITGTGALHQPGAEATEPDNSDQPQVTQGMPRLYQHLGWLLGLAFATLAIGLLVLYRSSPIRPRS
jgi:hypothetical protein